MAEAIFDEASYTIVRIAYYIFIYIFEKYCNSVILRCAGGK